MAVSLNISIALDYLVAQAEDQPESWRLHIRGQEMQIVVELLVAGLLLHGYFLGYG